MDLVSRAKAVVLKPKEEWLKIKEEPATVAQLFQSYAVPLAAIPAVAQFIGYGLIGMRVPFYGMYRLGLDGSLVRAVLAYVFSLLSVFLFAFIINVLAPNFKSKQDLPSAMKLAVYSMTPMWLAGILYIIPVLGVLAMLAGLYGLYVLYLGFATPLMDTPKEKVTTYYIVSLIVVIVLSVIFGLILGAIFVLRPGVSTIPY